MKKYLIFIFVATLSSLIGLFVGLKLVSKSEVKETPKPAERTMDKYSIENLAKIQIPKGEIKVEKTLQENPTYTSYLFTHNFDPTLENKNEASISGQLNVPKESSNFPVIVMVRGYVDKEIYQTGVGTQHAGEFFAQNGFITIAPDFLGYGTSSPESKDVLESRFQTYTTVLSILESLSSVQKWDQKNVFIWAHSNGGQIALTTLTITGKSYPTVLWAPVSKPFPYSILYYTDELPDEGKYLRAQIAKFENLYNVNLYSFDKYLDRIKAPIQVEQGTTDDAVPVKWTNDLVKRLKDKEVDVKYNTYEGSDHNLTPAWNEVVYKDILFFHNNTK
ncbi:alpha/beta hydrolase [Candidatus Woesebacteria bacterium]|nr:alpha/beta hydrolase [Candidatus Woesebacteria bacterium]QQG47237.1 MAG: alpha/beta hydrolase [Candidatus Woesebacteria bacterium]